MIKLLVLLVLVAFAGCGKSGGADPGEKQRKPKPPSTARQMIDGVTGKSAVDAGKRAMATLEKVGEKERKDFEEVLGE